ncbi:MAG: aldolase/citrate lyase family protein [Acidobacteria bacterium]|nr:aldolase/citrate lyase family protein [Acidobacteriota bacterium]
MRKSRVLEKLRKGGFARVCALGHFLPFFVRYAAHCRYDGIWLDLEHRTMTEREVQTLLACCHMHSIDCMVRPATVERTQLTRYLEDGASGFMIPFVSTGQVARQIVDAIKFPPQGNRGFDGTGLDGDYGIQAWEPDSEYTISANEETFAVAQIETPEAVRNVEEIAVIPGIDVLFVGPGDLGLRLAVSPNGMTLDQAIERVAQVAKRQGKAWGLAVSSANELARYRQMGAQLVPWGVDFALAQVLETCSKEIDEALLRSEPVSAVPGRQIG